MDDAHHEINRRSTSVKRIIILALGVLLALALASPVALAQVGQGAKASGEAAELAAAWTQWAYSKPAAESPLIGPNEDHPVYSEEQCDGTPLSTTQGKTWFLAGTPDSSVVERTCTMPVGTKLFFPVVSASFFITEPGENEQIARAFVTNRINAVEDDPDLSIVVTVDGKEINSNRIVRAQTPFFSLTFEAGNIFSVPPGAYTTISDGLWVALPPLPPGEHTIHFKMDRGPGDFSQDNTYNLTVVNKGKSTR
jgi:hypothetical protein